MPECQSPECDKTFEQPKVGPKKLYCDQRCKATARRRKRGVPKKTVITGDRKAYEREWHRRRRRRLGIPERKPAMSAEEREARKAVYRENRNRKRREQYVKRPRKAAKPKPQRNATVHVHVEQPRALPFELSRAWGRAGFGSQMRRKYPTREALVAAYRRGDVPDPATDRLEA